MRAKLIEIVLKGIVKYLKSHPDAIPGTIDDRLIPILAKYLGV
ncbi:hypothetical protein SEA_DARTHPHADER_10 [Mycobacterium phage DarthPhader]|uniref:Uncharacterized protein n=1 Tax=Mycobacterium phage DarthPhader TaxID=1912975 RepID=A0A1I9S3V6_9CAUD|nr:hypothetical protein KIV60_gp91 [Mycobacterium phage DarthPhader]AOZ61250.1 hypothetical protein SEA_DARTHPHADER_10 [Mycobacterium phage DarthPhader]